MYDLLNQQCTLFTNPSTPDHYGRMTWTTSEIVDCRFVRTTKWSKNDVNITCKFQIADRAVKVADKIGFEGNFYIIEMIKDWRDNDIYYGCVAYCIDAPYDS